ncbi:DUF2827 domain-containing protein [Burkholderia reimsis]|uniref:DUF2827 domain-containing protein n=1 Tax=Burkholderia reimsis TaxID=2234132 RepID=A0A365QHM5_9BURK|nr:DUF2827 domain-containing protein [Burkholderia reimsis]RBB32226.1 DUF2827 domain-containing protein [Burkholderia reimsis]
MNERRKLKVGVTIYLREGAQSIWENGIFQNCFFLVMLLRRSPIVGEVFLVNGGPGRPTDAGDFLALAPAPVIDLNTAQEKLDVTIELSAQLDVVWAKAFREKGGHIIGMRVANDYVIDIERMMFDKPHGTLVSGTPYSAVWTLPAFEMTCADYYGATMRAPVRAMPHLWSPALLERSIRDDGSDLSFAYQPGRARWRLAVLEPNICMVKTCHIPMLVADVAHRHDPNFIEVLRVFNAMRIKEDQVFVGFARSLDLVRHGIGTFEPRMAVYQIMSRQADAVIAHHWENGQNYVYYEALHGGYPLIHNSAFIGGCGYRYADFDCEEGALALRRAYAEHDANLDAYRHETRKFLATLDPESDENVRIYSAELEALFA